MATGLDYRHRDKDGEISKKHGNTLVSTLRKIYGDSFAPEFEPHQTLSEVLRTLDEPSLSRLIEDHKYHRLDLKVSASHPKTALP
jgi:hypothetical protein